MKYDFICLNNDGFDGLRRPRQILMQRLALHGYRVLFVSTASRKKSRASSRFGRIIKIKENLFWYDPPRIIPIFYRNFLRKLAVFIRSNILRVIIKLFSKKKKVFFVSIPNDDYVKYLNGRARGLIVYNVHDRFVNSAGEWCEEHRKMLEISDVVVCTSTFLVQEMHNLTEKPVYYFPPGVDFDFFPKKLDFVHRNLSANSRITVGCVGSLGFQIDWALIDRLSDEFPDYDFQFIGIIQDHIRSNQSFVNLQTKKNVFFIALVPHNEIPHFMAHFDICIAPYAESEFVKGVNPLKLYEYFAFGKPVVSYPLPSIQQFKDIVYTADGIDEWRRALVDAAAENDEEKFQLRRDVALGQDYDIRMKSLLDLVEVAQVAKRPHQAGREFVQADAGVYDGVQN